MKIIAFWYSTESLSHKESSMLPKKLYLLCREWSSEDYFRLSEKHCNPIVAHQVFHFEWYQMNPISSNDETIKQ